jgi:hypothetical protein
MSVSVLTRVAALGVSAAAIALLPAATASAADAVNTFKNQATNRCIDDSSAGFRTWACNSGQNQSWF